MVNYIDFIGASLMIGGGTIRALKMLAEKYYIDSC